MKCELVTILLCIVLWARAQDTVAFENLVGQINASQPQLVRTAIVSTVRNPGPEFDSWICYHLSIGFSKIYLFFDDPNDPDLGIAEKYSRVRIIKRDAELQALWRKASQWAKFGWWIDKEVMARQILNAEVAIGFATKDRVKWLLHIDADELFYAPNVNHVGQHFKQLQEQGFDTAVYLNYEGVPERLDSKNYFKSTTTFKRNPVMVNTEESIPMHRSWMRGKWFYFAGYWTGKSALKVQKDVYPLEVTRWYRKGEKRANFDDPIILHYINPTFSITKKKYEMLGNFDDETFSRKSIDFPHATDMNKLPIAGPGLKSHLDMRDVFFKNPDRKLDEVKQDYFHKMGVFEQEKEFYKVLLVEINFVKHFLENRLCQGSVSVATAGSSPLPPLDETNTCHYAPNVYCFSKYDCCNMLYNSRQALNQRDNPRAPVGKFTGNLVGTFIGDAKK